MEKKQVDPVGRPSLKGLKQIPQIHRDSVEQIFRENGRLYAKLRDGETVELSDHLDEDERVDIEKKPIDIENGEQRTRGESPPPWKIIAILVIVAVYVCFNWGSADSHSDSFEAAGDSDSYGYDIVNSRDVLDEEAVGAQRAAHLTQRAAHLFVGNPGSGKSSLLNALIGDAAFDSGVSFGGVGRTTETKIVSRSGAAYLDTPGLADVQMQREAAKEITAALRSADYFKVFFVISLRAGRLLPEDLATMKLVLDSAPIDRYSVIINKVDRSVCKAFESDNGKKLDELKATICSKLPHCPDSLHIIPFLAQLFDSENVIWADSPGLDSFNSFVREAPAVWIDRGKVEDINIVDFEALEKEMAKKQEDIQRENKKLEDLIRKKAAELQQLM